MNAPAPAPPPRILSLDGGGIRGKSSLLVLENIMEAIKKAKGLEAVPRPCDCFDLIGGTSTGGIIAIMLGRLGMTVDECIRAYDKLARTAFTPKLTLLPASPKGAYSAQALESAIRKTVREFCSRSPCVDQRCRGQSTAESCQHEDPGFRDASCTKTVVLAITKDNVDARPILFTTYDTSTSYEGCAIWQVARATSAATTFFKPIRVGRDNVEFIDAGFGYNNPCEVLIEEARRQFRNHSTLHILSIGTGLGGVVEIKDSRRSILNALKKMASTSTAVAERLASQYGDGDRYYRFNVDRGLQDITLSDWKKTSTISAHTGNYLRNNQRMIQKFVDSFTKRSEVHVSAAGTQGLIPHYIPLPKNTHFVGRTETLELLTRKILTPSGHQRFALFGLGGVGKTQVALKLAYEAKDVHGFTVLWLQAASNAAFQQACTEAVNHLSLQAAKDEDPKELLQKYLSSEKAGKWLLVIDNIDEVDVLLGSSDKADGINRFLPDSDSGRILFTTRLYDIAERLAGDNVHELKGMNYEEARSCLEKKITINIEDDVAARELLSQLTHLPLAITQAAAFMRRNKISIRKYLGLLREAESNMVELLSWQFYDKDRYEGSQNAVALTWRISFDRICATDPAAAELLRFIAMIEPKTIPQSMLPANESKIQLINAIGTLIGYAFLDIGEEDKTYNMHSLVHLATRTWVKARGEEAKATANAAASLSGVFPRDDWENRELWRQYMPHALRLLREGGDRLQDGETLGYWVGRCLDVDGRYKDAQEVFERVVARQETALAEDNPTRLASQHSLATAYQANGQAGKAIKLLEHVASVETALAKDHPSRLASQHALARAYQENGQVKKAIELLEHVVLIRDTALAKDHPERLASQHALAIAYQENGQVKQAIELLEHVVSAEATFPDDHPSRLASQHALAEAYRENGQAKKTIELLEHVVSAEVTLPDDHPERLSSQHALAIAYRENGQVKQAIELLEHVVLIKETALAEDDPSRLVSQHELAIAYRADGQVEKAVQLLEHVVLIKETALAEDDPSRLVSQHALAITYQADGQVEKAVQLLEHVVLIKETALAEDDPSRLVSQHALAITYQADGQVEKAVQLLEHVVPIQERLFAEDHPDRLASQYTLARAYQADRQVEKAVQLLEHVFLIEETALAEDDPSRLVSPDALARAYRANGQVEKAVKLLEHVVSIRERSLPEGHPSRLASQRALAEAYRVMGR